MLGFRNHVETTLELESGLSVFAGNNGHGKSNLLEAIYMLAIAKSPRTSSERELINWRINETGGHVQILGIARDANVTTQAQIDFDALPSESEHRSRSLRKVLRVNGIIRNASDYVGNVNVVFFEADDLSIITGPPSTRRRYLDILIAQILPSYLKSLQRFSKVISQRNHLLRRIRDGSASIKELEFWNERLTYEGAQVIQQRQEVVVKLNQSGISTFKQLTEGSELSLKYKPQLNPYDHEDQDLIDLSIGDIRERLMYGIKKCEAREIAQGVSVIGPHRDDLLIFLDGNAAASYASRGQARTLALSLKFAEAFVVREATGRAPVLALDDILSELDPARRFLVLSALQDYDQVLLTTTEFEALDPSFLKKSRSYSIKEGIVSTNGE